MTMGKVGDGGATCGAKERQHRASDKDDDISRETKLTDDNVR